MDVPVLGTLAFDPNTSFSGVLHEAVASVLNLDFSVSFSVCRWFGIEEEEASCTDLALFVAESSWTETQNIFRIYRWIYTWKKN